MKKLLLACLVAVTGCTNFDELGDEARCAAASCDAGGSGFDAGNAVDAGLDAGAPDAGSLDGGAVDASIETLVVAWAATDPLPRLDYRIRPGAVLPSVAGGVLLFRERALVHDTPNLPAGYIFGDVTEFDTSTGAIHVLPDAGLRRDFVPAQRWSIIPRADAQLLTVSEALDDGGSPPPTTDGGAAWSLGSGLIAYSRGGFVPNAAAPTPGPALAASIFTETDGGIFAGFIQTYVTVPARSSLTTIRGSTYTTSNDFVAGCTEKVLDSVMVAETTAGLPDERIVTLSNCQGNAMYLSNYTPRPDINSGRTLVATGTTNARLAIAPESLGRRVPMVAWRTTSSSTFFLQRFNATGSGQAIAFLMPRQLTDAASPTARIEAMAVDADGTVLIVFSADEIHFIGGPLVTATATKLILASFAENLTFRSAATLQGPDELKCNSATFAQKQLVLELQCPNAMNDAIVPGGICKKDLWSIAAKVALPDGGLP